MGLNKVKGNMYDWVTHTHTHLAGKCPHECSYCSIQDMQRRFPQLPYSGPLRLKEEEFKVQYGSGKTIFVENCNDLFADAVPDEWIYRIMGHCRQWPDNTYVFQTKNPGRMGQFRMNLRNWPIRFVVGATIETNRNFLSGNAPQRRDRLASLLMFRARCFPIFVTIEPIMDFDLEEFAELLIEANPDFINIGADSKGHGLPEPSFEKVMALIDRLKEAGIEIREKRNLDRLRTNRTERTDG